MHLGLDLLLPLLAILMIGRAGFLLTRRYWVRQAQWRDPSTPMR